MAEHLISYEQAETEILACATYLAEKIGGSEEHAAAMATLVPRYLVKGEVDLAAELADTVADPFTRDKLLIEVAGKCAETGDDDYAFQLAEAVEDYGLQEAARERIALEKALKSDYTAALEIAGDLEHPANAYAGIAVHQAKIGEQANAEQTVEMIDYPAVKIHALQTIASLNAQKNDNAKAAELLEKAVEIAGKIEYDEEEIRAFTEIGVHFLEAGRNTRAVETLDKAKSIAETLDNVHRDAFLANVAHGLLRAGSLELADRTLDLVTDKTQISACLLAFSQEFWTKGEQGEAVEALEEAYQILKSQRDQETRDTRAKLQLFAAIAVRFAQYEKPERAIEIAQENADETQQNAALQQIAQICAAKEKDEIAQQAVDAIKDEGQKLFALSAMANAKNELGKTAEAASLLNEVEEKIESVPQHSVRFRLLAELAERGAAEKTAELLREALKTAAEIRSQSARAEALAYVAEAYEKHKLEVSEADRQTLRQMLQHRSL